MYSNGYWWTLVNIDSYRGLLFVIIGHHYDIPRTLMELVPSFSGILH